MKTFTEKQLVSFGNYLLSKTRKENTSKINRGNVTHADFENWRNELE